MLSLLCAHFFDIAFDLDVDAIMTCLQPLSLLQNKFAYQNPALNIHHPKKGRVVVECAMQGKASGQGTLQPSIY